MVVLTAWPYQISHSRKIELSVFALVCMMCLGAVLVVGMLWHTLPAYIFLPIVAIDGVLTGLVQILGSSIASAFPSRRVEGEVRTSLPGAVLIGEAASPLLTTAIAAMVRQTGWATFERSALAIAIQMVFLVAAISALFILTKRRVPVSPLMSGKGLAVLVREEDVHVIWKRVRNLYQGSLGVFSAALVWIFLICSFPYVSHGLCGGDVECTTFLPPIMVGSANVAAFVGRVLGNYMLGSCQLWALILETAAFLVLGLLVIYASEGLAPVGVSYPLAIAVLMSGGLVLWSNTIIIRLFDDAQTQFQHLKDVCAAKNHCAITSQISWVALQVGSVAGTGLSFFAAQ
jgi:hypothetical protein